MYAVAVALVLIVAISSARVQQRSNCEATAFVLEDLERRPVVASPDDRWYVELGMKTQDHEEGWFLVRRGTTTVRSFKLEYLSAGVFVKWAADSTPFYLMWSNGGAIGEYSVRVFRITGGTVVEVPSSAQAERTSLGGIHARGHNTFAIRWMNGSRELLVAQDPAGDCGPNAGRLGGYLVRVDDGAVVGGIPRRSYNEYPEGCPTWVYPTAFLTSEDFKKAQGARRKGRGGGN